MIPPAPRLVVRVLQDVVRQEPFACYADLAEALKARCARLRIPFSSDVISQAIDRLELGGRVRLIDSTPQRPRQPAPLQTTPPISRRDAARLYTRLLARYHDEHAPTDDHAHDFPALVEIKWR